MAWLTYGKVKTALFFTPFLYVTGCLAWNHHSTNTSSSDNDHHAQKTKAMIHQATDMAKPIDTTATAQFKPTEADFGPAF